MCCVRVIAGIAKGTTLAPAPRGVRPVTDRARAGIFSSLAPRLEGAIVLDLFAGTGALAIEALSRGADRAVLVERDASAVRSIRRNLASTKLADHASVVRSEVGRFLSRNDSSNPAFDLVFVDPPYEVDQGALSEVLNRLEAGWLADAEATMVVTRRAANPIDVVPLHWRVARRLVYGDSLAVLFRR
jgi:16S rRNA (guanine966-N2)-methyltransferase